MNAAAMVLMWVMGLSTRLMLLLMLIIASAALARSSGSGDDLHQPGAVGSRLGRKCPASERESLQEKGDESGLALCAGACAIPGLQADPPSHG